MSAGDHTLAHLADCVKKVREHEHAKRAADGVLGYDLYCLNLIAHMGEELQAEVRMWRDRNTALAEEAGGYLDRLTELEDES